MGAANLLESCQEGERPNVRGAGQGDQEQWEFPHVKLRKEELGENV